ncbi:type I secretion protein [Epibacterium sp. SM1979]|uniref:Type I secretion protein n=1 Tax=Tritonibacter litoralis TaxID=2662264 RepID=A0A843Y8S2_9RHOB|nr:Hint domain-containing protein [Tritonibacter litoralis]MQQ07286.1 type I secretion protein [Tritonibacter litoralis]
MADNFDNPYAANLIGLWDFRNGFENDDTGLGDGIAQDGAAAGGGVFASDQFFGDGFGARFDVDDGDDQEFDLTAGSIVTSFNLNTLDGTQTVVSRGLAGADGSDPEQFEIRVTEDGRVQVFHAEGGETALLTTDPGFLDAGDQVKVIYSWTPDGVKAVFENTTDGTSTTASDDTVSLDLDITSPSEQSFAIGARETTEGIYDQNLSGGIDYVAVLDDDVIAEGLDGIVEGTEGGDLIDESYLGDPEGDRIDAGDAINPADGPDDDLVQAGGGDDTVLAGEGDDTVHGGGGNDSIEGGTGDDVLHGDSNVPGATTSPGREVFRWDEAPDPDDGGQVDSRDDLSGGFSQDTGSVTVEFSVLNQDANVDTEFSNVTNHVTGINSGGGTVDTGSSLSSLTNGRGNEAEYRLDFSGPVEDVSFRINDIDGGGVVRVTAFDADGNPVEVNIGGGPNLTLADTDTVPGDDTAISDGAYSSTDDPSYSLLVNIPGPVSRIEIEHEQDGGNSGIQVTDVYFDPIVDVPVTDPGNDTIDGGDGDDIIIAGDGDDSVIGGDGSDSVSGDDGDDVIDTSGNGPAPLPDRGFDGYTGTTPDIPAVPADADPEDDRDTVDGGAGDDTITTGDDADLITGGDGLDVIDGGIDDDTIDGGDDADEITGGEGSDSLLGGEGDDTIYGGLDPVFPDGLNITDDGSDGRPVDPDPTNGMDTIDGGAGNDLIFGQDDDDSIDGGTGNDTIDAGIDDDTVVGGEGDDSILGGQGADDLSGGLGEDTIDLGTDGQADTATGGLNSDLFTGAGVGDDIVGGEDPDGSDVDVLDLRGTAEPGGSISVDFTPGDAESGTVSYFDADGVLTGTATFSEIENVIPCFTPGTLIATPEGERRVEDLQVGDRVITRDNGIQEIRWFGQRHMTGAELSENAKLQPILIRQGALGNGLPERDMMVSPNHRVLVANDKTALYFEDREVLVAAKHLVGLEGVDAVEADSVTYIHFMFDQHEVVLSDGSWTESFQPGDQTLRGLDSAQRAEIFALFPELKSETGREAYVAARRSLKKHEARLLVH